MYENAKCLYQFGECSHVELYISLYAGLEISQNWHLPCITKIIDIYGYNINFHWKSSKIPLALQPGALVNTSGRVDFSSPDMRMPNVGTSLENAVTGNISVYGNA